VLGIAPRRSWARTFPGGPGDERRSVVVQTPWNDIRGTNSANGAA
jgi:hypothetical protein